MVAELVLAPDVHVPLVRSRLAEWFGVNGREFPWRGGATPWGVLVSEVMSQQTPLARVEPVWRDWMGRWPGPDELAQAPTSEVLRVWGSLGYPRRALRLQDCARTLVAEFDSEVPSTEAELLTLPGVGVYTAAAVVAFAFGKRSVVVDTNVRRVLARVFQGSALAEPNVTVGQMRHAADVVPEDDTQAALWSVSSMEFGALVCTARAPRCSECPLADVCAWRAAGFPPDAHADRRRTQAWHGTDRQVRGGIMAILRASPSPVARPQLDVAWPGPPPEPGQVERCVAALVSDGLIVTDDDGVLALP